MFVVRFGLSRLSGSSRNSGGSGDTSRFSRGVLFPEAFHLEVPKVHDALSPSIWELDHVAELNEDFPGQEMRVVVFVQGDVV